MGGKACARNAPAFLCYNIFMKINIFYKIFCPKLLKKFLEQKEKIGVDNLTGLRNRAEYEFEIEYLFKKKRRKIRDHRKITRVFHIFIDLDNFKCVNDTMGHSKGDLLLQEISDVFINNLRDVDQIFRFAGDEFIAIIQRIKKEEVAKAFERVTNEIKKITGFDSCGISISAGGYEIDFIEDDPKIVLEKSDKAMYAAKKTGKNKILFYRDVIDV